MGVILLQADSSAKRSFTVTERLLEMEDVHFYPYINPAAVFPLRHLFLRESQIVGFADPIGRPS